MPPCARIPDSGPVAQWIEQGTPKPLVGGSIPSGPASPHLSRGFAISPLAKPGEKAPAHPLREAVEGFLLTKRVAGCTEATLRCYSWWLGRLLAEAPIPTPLAVRSFFARLQERGLSPPRQHQAYRTLRAFFRWGVDTSVITEDPLRGLKMRTPKTLPDVPTEDELRAVLTACSQTLEGIRNRALWSTSLHPITRTSCGPFPCLEALPKCESRPTPNGGANRS